MAFQSDKTGRHLREQALADGVKVRMRAVHALGHGYGAGSQAALASLILATLGGSTTMGDNVSVEDGKPWLRKTLVEADVRKVAQPMQGSANDMAHDSKDVLGAY